MEYIVFTDESNITASQFQSLSAFSLPYCYYDELTSEVNKILYNSQVLEFKWQKLKNAKNYFCAEKLIALVFAKLYSFNLRVDTVMWDMNDSRHSINRRDDMANYERLFFHLLNNSMKKRKKNCVWHIRPDVRSGIDWKTIHGCLSCVGQKQELQNTIFGSFFSDPFFKIKSFKEKESHKEILIQIADLFSGLLIFSRTNFKEYQEWKSQQTITLFDLENKQELSNREEYRGKILDQFNNKCKQNKLGVSLNSKKCLHTFNPENPLNFWCYEPQGKYDKAPVKS